jgi:hypothetical protein
VPLLWQATSLFSLYVTQSTGSSKSGDTRISTPRSAAKISSSNNG